MRLLILAVCLVAGLSVPASASVLNFEVAPVNGDELPRNYGGVQWDNINVLKSADLPVSGYAAGLVSGRKVAFNGYGLPAAIYAFQPFRFNQAYITAAWYSNLVIEVTALLGATPQWSVTIHPSATAPTLFSFPALPVDIVNFTPISGGTVQAGYPGDGYEFVLDDVNVDLVPEPIASVLTGVAVIGLGVARRRN